MQLATATQAPALNAIFPHEQAGQVFRAHPGSMLVNLPHGLPDITWPQSATIDAINENGIWWTGHASTSVGTFDARYSMMRVQGENAYRITEDGTYNGYGYSNEGVFDVLQAKEGYLKLKQRGGSLPTTLEMKPMAGQPDGVYQYTWTGECPGGPFLAMTGVLVDANRRDALEPALDELVRTTPVVG